MTMSVSTNQKIVVGNTFNIQDQLTLKEPIVIVTMDCPRIINMITNYMMLDVKVRQFVAYIQIIGMNIQHILGCNNNVVDMLL